MRTWRFRMILLATLAAYPSLAHAQASITGTVRDASGAVLPGVTVDAASPGAHRVKTSSQAFTP